MPLYVPPSIKLHTLSTADGSVTYTSPSSTHTLICGVNYPLEVPYRSDEDPESTYIEVSLRPHNGVSMVRERYIEEIVRKTLQTVVLGEDMPRCMLQCTIQILEMQDDDALPGGVKGGYQGESCLDLIVGVVNASILGCLDGAVRMRRFAGAVLVGIADNATCIISPNVRERKRCESLHAFGFDSRGKCILLQSEGIFDMESWEQAEGLARQAVCGTHPVHADSAANGDEDIDMDNAGGHDNLFHVMRASVEARVGQDDRWQS